MEVKGEGKKCKVVECAMRPCVSVRERVYACEKQPPVASVERDLDFPLKREKKNTKQDSNREKVHKFLPAVLFRRRKAIFFCLKLRLFEIYSLPLRLIKHNLPFFLPPGGVHIARIHGLFLRVETQMLFDLLNDFGCSPRGKSRSGMFEALPNFGFIRHLE